MADDTLRAEVAALKAERKRFAGAVAAAAEYDAWIRFHSAGNGDFHDFLRDAARAAGE